MGIERIWRILVPRNRVCGHGEVPRETPMRTRHGWIRTETELDRIRIYLYRDRFGTPGVHDGDRQMSDGETSFSTSSGRSEGKRTSHFGPPRVLRAVSAERTSGDGTKESDLAISHSCLLLRQRIVV